MNSNSEKVLAKSNKDVIEKLRTALMDAFCKDRLWLYVYEQEDKFEISVSNYWGGSLDKETTEKVVNYANKFMLDEDGPVTETKLDMPSN